MKYCTTFLLAVCTMTVCAAFGGHHGGHHGPEIASCEADKPAHAACMKSHLQAFGDMDKIKACFSTCAAAKHPSTNKGGVEHHDATGDRATMQEFMQCEQKQHQACIAANSHVVFTTPAAHEEDMFTRHGGEHGGKGEWKGKGEHHNGTAKGHRGQHDMLAMLMSSAAHCNVTACVKPLIRADLLVNTTAGSAIIKKAMCQARQACKPSAKCQAERAAVKAAACTCKQQAHSTTSPNPCMTPAVQALFAAHKSSGSSASSHHEFKGKGGEKHDACSTAVPAPEVC